MTTDASQQKEPTAIREPKPVQPALSAMEKFFFLKPLRRVYARVQGAEPGILERLLREMNITVGVAPEDLARVPRTGAALVVANHPFGILDGAALGAILLRVRPDTKILTNSLVAAVDELEQHCIQIDPFARPGARGTNILGLRKAIAHLRGGGVLAVFPSGEVSHWQFRQSEVTDPEWNTTAARLARLSGAPVVPALFVGRNSLPFHLFGIIHPRLRTIQLSREFLKKAGQAIELRIGTPVPPQKIARLADDRQRTDYLRWRTYLLRRRRPDPTQSAETQETYSRNLRPSRKALISEIESLDAQCKLHENQEFQVFVADAERIPRALVEIGRQRELAFQEVGAGTGRGVDLDPFDPHYKHLILWHKKDSKVAGGYRFVNTAEVLCTAGQQGLYTTTLFSIDPKFFESMGPMLEVGRSFVRHDYQKQYAPLMLMWRGIGRYVGPIGSATVAKLVHNMSGYAIICALAETFTLGVKAGMDPLMLWQAVRQGAVGRRFTFDALIDQFLPGEYDPPAFALKLAHKDVSLANALGRELGMPMRLCNLTLAEMTEALARGWGARDSRVMMLLQQERAGVEIAVDRGRLREALAPTDGKAS